MLRLYLQFSLQKYHCVFLQKDSCTTLFLRHPDVSRRLGWGQILPELFPYCEDTNSTGGSILRVVVIFLKHVLYRQHTMVDQEDVQTVYLGDAGG